MKFYKSLIIDNRHKSRKPASHHGLINVGVRLNKVKAGYQGVFILNFAVKNESHATA